MSCETTTDKSQGTDGSSNDSSSTGCFQADGTEVDCWKDGYWWSPQFNRYCQVADVSPDNPAWDRHRDQYGNPVGTLYKCLVTIDDLTKATILWADDSPQTPPVPGSDPQSLVRAAVASLGLHPPVVGVGAYVYPGYEDWGLSWWVGAPMWLWVDAGDPLQWGAHTITASDDGLSVAATVTATSATFDTGDGDTVTCDTPGTPRAWDPGELLSRHSPTGCEHAYMATNILGDEESRYTVSATVAWTVTWSSSDGQAGSFTTTTASVDGPAVHVGELHVVLAKTPR